MHGVTSFVLLLGAFLTPRWMLGQDSERRRFTPEDVHRIRDVRELAIAPDGDWVAYTVRSTDVDSDRRNADLFMVSWDGATRIQLTHSDGSEGSPRFSPDGKYLASITARGGDDSGSSKDPATKRQVWLLNRSGGEAERLTEMPGGVSNFEWSPDSTKLVLVSKDPKDDETERDNKASDDSKKVDTPKPIVIDRYQFKRDREGYLGERYQRIYVFEVSSRTATLLSPGAFDSSQPRCIRHCAAGTNCTPGSPPMTCSAITTTMATPTSTPAPPSDASTIASSIREPSL